MTMATGAAPWLAAASSRRLLQLDGKVGRRQYVSVDRSHLRHGVSAEVGPDEPSRVGARRRGAGLLFSTRLRSPAVGAPVRGEASQREADADQRDRDQRQRDGTTAVATSIGAPAAHRTARGFERRPS